MTKISSLRKCHEFSLHLYIGYCAIPTGKTELSVKETTVFFAVPYLKDAWILPPKSKFGGNKNEK
jgi:hypothetical protein